MEKRGDVATRYGAPLRKMLKIRVEILQANVRVPGQPGMCVIGDKVTSAIITY